MELKKTIERFMALFAGLGRAYGTYKLTGEKSAKGKAQGRATTIQEEVTTDLWRKHLEGEQGVGIVPIRDDDTVMFGAIDIDVYDLDLVLVEATVCKYDLPLVVMRSKSGGAHLYAFLTVAMQSRELRAALSHFAMLLGHPGVEVFPKQDQLAGPGDVGNWINMPYYNCVQTTRYAIRDGKAIADVDEFLDYAESMRVSPEELIALEEKYGSDDELEGAPPCLQTMAMTGVPEGARNDAMFSFAVYATKRYQEDAAKYVMQYNDAYMQPPLPSRELKPLLRSMGNKDYFYKCNSLTAVCNKAKCRRCEYGIGDGADTPGVLVDEISKICSKPPIWIVQINGQRIQMDTEELMSQPKFGKRCVEAINYFPPSIKAHKWQQYINELLAKRVDIEAPPDAGAQGQFVYHLEQFCVTKAPANNKDELLLGKPWHNEEDNRTYFRSADLFRYLENQKFRDLKEHQMFAILHAYNVDKHFFNIKGRGVNAWSVPTFDAQTEEFDVPRTEEEEF